MDKIAPYYKALTAFVVPFLTQIVAGLTPASDGGQNLTTSEWLTALITSLVAGGVVFAIPNKDPEASHQDESVQPPEADGPRGGGVWGGT
jgi:hypothetical protein